MDKKQLISFTKQLINIPTTNPPGLNYERIVSVLENKCRALGLKTRRVVTPVSCLKKLGVTGGSRRVSLIADWDLKRKKTLHITAHYDVVPPTKGWRRAPFQAAAEGDKIYGRGSEDMKGTIAAMLLAVETLKKSGARPRVNIQLSFCPDEETGGTSGFGYLVKKGLIRADYALSEGYGGGRFSRGSRGVIWARVTVRGKACHASMPHLGRNAFEDMLTVAGEFKKLKGKMVLGGELTGGNKVNVVPAEACFSIDRRVLPEEKLSDVKKELYGVIRRCHRKGIHCGLKIITEDQPWVIPQNHPLVKAMKKAIGRKAKSGIMPGATDLRFVMKKGIPAVGYSAQGGGRWHGDDEYVSLHSIIQTAEVYSRFIQSLVR